MKKLSVLILFVLILSNISYGNDSILEVKEVTKKSETKSAADSVNIDSTLELTISTGYYVVINVNGKCMYSTKNGKVAAVSSKGDTSKGTSLSINELRIYPISLYYESDLKIEEVKLEENSQIKVLSMDDYNKSFWKDNKSSDSECPSLPIGVKLHYIDTPSGKKLTGLGDVGDNITIAAFDTNDEIVQGTVKEYEIIKTWSYATLNNFIPQPILNIQIGKKKSSDENKTDVSEGVGLPFMFLYRSSDHKVFDNTLWGVNVSYTKTGIYNNVSKKYEFENLAVLSFAFGKILLKNIYIQGLLGANINGSDRFFQLGITGGLLVSK